MLLVFLLLCLCFDMFCFCPCLDAAADSPSSSSCCYFSALSLSLLLLLFECCLVVLFNSLCTIPARSFRCLLWPCPFSPSSSSALRFVTNRQSAVSVIDMCARSHGTRACALPLSRWRSLSVSLSHSLTRANTQCRVAPHKHTHTRAHTH